VEISTIADNSFWIRAILAATNLACKSQPVMQFLSKWRAVLYM